MRALREGSAFRSTHRQLAPDYYCIQSQLFGHATLNFVGQTRVLWKHTKRISDD